MSQSTANFPVEMRPAFVRLSRDFQNLSSGFFDVCLIGHEYLLAQQIEGDTERIVSVPVDGVASVSWLDLPFLG